LLQAKGAFLQGENKSAITSPSIVDAQAWRVPPVARLILSSVGLPDNIIRGRDGRRGDGSGSVREIEA